MTHAALAGGLVRVLAPFAMLVPVWLVTHGDLKGVARICQFLMQFLVSWTPAVAWSESWP